LIAGHHLKAGLGRSKINNLSAFMSHDLIVPSWHIECV
jgi:hypothetical protein